LASATARGAGVELLLAVHGDFPTLTLKNLWLLVKQRAPGISYEQVMKFYSLLESTEIRKTGKKERAENRPTHIDYIPIIAQPHTWQIDLMGMKKFWCGPHATTGTNTSRCARTY
jgi:hypothetical protein